MAKRNWRRVPWKLRYVRGARVMSEMRRLAIRLTHHHARVVIPRSAFLGPGFALSIAESGTLIVGHGVEFRRGFVCEIGGDGRVSIGAGSIFTSNALVQCSTSIDIGERCVFGQSTLIVDGYHRYDDHESHWLDQGFDFRPLTIGAGAGVSDKCTIQADVGERAMIASQSVVNRPIPAWCVASGSPARVVRRIGPQDAAPSAAPVQEGQSG